MRLIAIKKLREAAAIYPDLSATIEDFYQILKAATWHNLEAGWFHKKEGVD